jgi:hypothetical protein
MVYAASVHAELAVLSWDFYILFNVFQSPIYVLTNI